MLRDIDLNEISDGRLYTANDMVKADCMGCQGCASCCQGMGDSIVLDPYDMSCLTSKWMEIPIPARIWIKMAAAAYTLSVRDSAGSFHWGVTMKIILFHIFSRLTNVQNPARQRSKSVNGLMSRIFQGTKNSYPIGTTISNRYKTMLWHPKTVKR